jgi:hypothetical protein
MQERRTPEPNRPDPDATSDETLEDLEKKEKIPDSDEANSETPSPDGALDESDESKESGLM